MRYLLALILLAALPAWAAEINATAKLSWETPTTNVLGLPIKPESIMKYELYWGTAPDKLTNKINLIPPTNAYNWSATLPADADGAATAYFAILARNASPDPGPLSAIVSKRFVLDGSSAPPAPPGNVIVITAGCTAPPGWTCKVEPAP